MKYLLLIILICFAVLTLFLSSSVIFDWFEIRQKEGNYVLFIVWSNWISSILYLASAFSFFKSKKHAFYPLIVSASILFLAQIALYFHIAGGGLYETKTIGAMVFRTSLTILLAYLMNLNLKKNNQ